MQSISSEPIIAARALRTTIRSFRHETETARCLPASIVDKLIGAGLCRLAVPESLGGHEAEPLVSFDVYEELASADASVAWIAWNNSLPGLLSRYLSNAVRTELFADSHRLFANSTRPSGRAVMRPGGFRVSGRWSLVSGCALADWIPLLCIVTTDEGGQITLAEGIPEMRMAYVPKGSYKILDTWYSGGLRGTGSHDIVVDDIFVPAELTFSLEDRDHIDRPLYRMPFRSNSGRLVCGDLFRNCPCSNRHIARFGLFKGDSGSGAWTSRSAGGSVDVGFLDSSIRGRASAPA